MLAFFAQKENNKYFIKLKKEVKSTLLSCTVLHPLISYVQYFLAESSLMLLKKLLGLNQED